MPLLMAKRALSALPSGAVLEVLSTDSGSERDFESFARLAGHVVECERLADDVLKLTITRPESRSRSVKEVLTRWYQRYLSEEEAVIPVSYTHLTLPTKA